MKTRRVIVQVVVLAIGAGVGFALWRWAAGRQHQSFWWFLLAMTPSFVATWIADAANDALDRRMPSSGRPG
mgnify:CR=1 FL=1